jgi:hypothetical protein
MDDVEVGMIGLITKRSPTLLLSLGTELVAHQ